MHASKRIFDYYGKPLKVSDFTNTICGALMVPPYPMYCGESSYGWPFEMKSFLSIEFMTFSILLLSIA